MAFDAPRYRREVLDPARAAGNRPTDDLRLRYQLPDPLTPDTVREALAAVRAHWRRERASLAYRKVIDALAAGDRDLQEVFEAACAGQLGPLRREIAHRQSRQSGRQRALAAELAGLAEPLGLLTPAVVAQVAADGHDRQQLAQVLHRLDIQVREPDPVPGGPPPAGFSQLRESLTTLDCRHTADFLFGAAQLAGGFTVLDRFAVTGQPALRLDQRQVSEVARRWQSRLEGKTPAETVLTVLRTRSGPEQLRELLVRECAEDLRRRRDRQASATALLARARELGLTEPDSRRLVFAVRNEPARRGSALADQLSRLVEDRAVMAAHRLVAGLPADALPDDARELAGQVERLAGQATARREQAAASGDPDTAWRLLAEAEAFAPDLPELAAMRRRLPPRPAGRPRATVAGATVVISWAASPTQAGEVSYRVLRATGPIRDSAQAATGRLVGHTTALLVRDRDAPVNTALHYAVVAERGGVTAGPVAAGPVWLHPDVSELRVSAGDRLVSAAWQLPPGATGVQVRRAEGGRPPDLAGGTPITATSTGLADRQVTAGCTYHYLVVTAYTGPDGQVRHSAGVRFTAVPAAAPDPVGQLHLAPAEGEPGWLVAAFPAPGNGQVQLRELAGPPEHPPGTRLATSALPGRAVPAVPVPGGLKLPAPPPAALLLAVTVNGELAAIGPHRQWLAAPAPGRLRAQHRAGAVLVTWQWPDGVGEVELRWRVVPATAGTGWGSRPVTSAQYRAGGGAQLRLAAGAEYEITAAARLPGGGDQHRAAGQQSHTRVRVPALGSYTVARRGRRAARRVEVTVRVEQPVRVDRLVLVTAAGGLPLRPEDGELLAAAEDLTLTPATPAVLAAGAAGRRGHWLRCFAPGAAVELRDPPREQLRLP